MKRRLERLFARFGEPVTVDAAGQSPATVRAFVRLVTSRTRETFHRTWTGLGETPPGRVLYLGPAEPELKTGMVIRAGGTSFLVRRCAGVKLGGETVYQWGLLSREGA